MIVFCDRQLLIITPPKCASGSLHEHFCSRGAYYVIGKCDPRDPNAWHHVATVPTEFMFYRVAVVTRDPRDRLVSLFHHLNAWRTEQQKRPYDFPEFVDLATTRRIGHWLYEWTISDLLAPLTPRALAIQRPTIDHVIHFETLADDLHQLGLDAEGMPHIRRSDRQPWQEYYDEQTRPKVDQWGEVDDALTAFG